MVRKRVARQGATEPDRRRGRGPRGEIRRGSAGAAGFQSCARMKREANMTRAGARTFLSAFVREPANGGGQICGPARMKTHNQLYGETCSFENLLLAARYLYYPTYDLDTGFRSVLPPGWVELSRQSGAGPERVRSRRGGVVARGPLARFWPSHFWPVPLTCITQSRCQVKADRMGRRTQPPARGHPVRFGCPSTTLGLL